jgi:hypothetical protein
MFQISVNWLGFGILTLIFGAVFFFCLLTVYKSENKREKNLAFVFIVFSVLLLSLLEYHRGWSQFVGTTEEFKMLDDGIVFKHDKLWEGTNYSLVQRLDEKDKVTDSRIIRNVPSEIPVGSKFLLKGGRIMTEKAHYKVE